MSLKLNKTPTIDQDEELPVSEEETSREEFTLDELDANAIAAKVGRKNPFERSQQYKEAYDKEVKKAMLKKGKANDNDEDQSSGSEYIPSGSGDNEDEDESESVETDATEKYGAFGAYLRRHPSNERDDVKVIKIERKMPQNEKPRYVKNLSKSLDGSDAESLTKKKGLVKRSTVKDLSKVSYGVEKAATAKRIVTRSQAPVRQSSATVNSVEKNPPRRSRSADNSTMKPKAPGAPMKKVEKRPYSRQDSDVVVAYTSKTTKKQRIDSDEEHDDDLVVDFAPDDHAVASGKKMREGDVHIGANVHVKWHRFKGTDYIMIRHFVNGQADGRRGINIDTKFLPNLKKAIDMAYKCYGESR